MKIEKVTYDGSPLTVKDFDEAIKLMDLQLRQELPQFIFIRKRILSKWDEAFRQAANEYIKNLKMVNYHLKIFNLSLFALHLEEKQGWFRVFGKGISWKHTIHGMTFSQRNGYTKYLRIRNYIFTTI